MKIPASKTSSPVSLRSLWGRLGPPSPVQWSGCGCDSVSHEISCETIRLVNPVGAFSQGKEKFALQKRTWTDKFHTRTMKMHARGISF